MDNSLKILNDVSVNLDEYEEYKPNDIEKNNMKINIKKKIKSRSFNNKRKINMTAAILFGLIIITTSFGSDVFAEIKVFGNKIEKIMSTNNKSIDEYKTVINKTVADNDISVKMNEVLIDDNQIIISSTFYSDKVNLEKTLSMFPKVYINGKEVSEGGGCKVEQNKDSTYTSLALINANDINLDGNLNIKVSYRNIGFEDGKSINGKWDFKLTANKDNLTSEVRTIPLNKSLTLDSGQEIVIENFKITPITATIHYTMTNGKKYDLHFKVEDQNGNELKFFSGRTMGINNYFRYNTLDESITKLKVTPFLISGYEGELKKDFKKILQEEAFEINIR